MTVLITGTASGMGAATADRLRAAGRSVLGADLHDADIVADLATPTGREAAVRAAADLDLDGVATFAGVAGFGGRPGSLVVSLNYFGSIHLLERLRPTLARSQGAAVAVSSNAATTAPGIAEDLVEACLAGDEAGARDIADRVGGPAAYAASKLAVARWVRRHAPTPDWAGASISLNAIAPGHVETALTEEMMREPEARAVIERSPLPIGRTAHPDEVAALTEFLLGDHGRFVVGSVVYIDGGVDALRRADDWPTGRPPRTPTASA
jgi:NAD(P)-dependent dehydrogenase (short-subunit alcohol dehydrogenase family)